jgi:hypothetical protein
MHNKTPYCYRIVTGDILINDAPPIAHTPHAPLEAGDHSQNKYHILERYYNDIYKLFLNRLSKFDCDSASGITDRKKLKSLLDELIYVKTLLEEES